MFEDRLRFSNIFLFLFEDNTVKPEEKKKMKRRGGGVGSQSSSTSSLTTSREMSSNRQFETSFLSNDRVRTIFLTSSIWIIIVSLGLFTLTKYNSSAACAQNNLIKSIYKKLCLITKDVLFVKDTFCGIGQFLTRFCSDSYQFEQQSVRSSRLFYFQ